jgi:hypothetical protein
MRATYMQFRSPKENNSEFFLPEVKGVGNFSGFDWVERKRNFAKGKRFSQYLDDARKTQGIGPGSYNLCKFPEKIVTKHCRAMSVDSPPVISYKFYNVSVLHSIYPTMPKF